MREETLFKMVMISLLLHIVVVGFFSIQMKKTARRIELPYYSVSLVGHMEGGKTESPTGAPPQTQKRAAIPPTKIKAPERKPPKPTVQPKEKERSINPKLKEREKEKVHPADVKKKEISRTTKEDVKSLDQRIREMKKRTQYVDIGGTGTGDARSSASSSGNGSASLDPLMEDYINKVREKIEEVWKAPWGLALRKDLQTVVSIKIRKDGRLSDWTVEEKSANRAYDESVVRALRFIDKFPPPPDNQDRELTVAFHPPQGR